METKIEIDSRDLNLSVDLYQEYDGEGTRKYMEQMAREHLQEEGKDPDDYEIEIRFDMDEILRSMAISSVCIVKDFIDGYVALNPEAKGIILSVGEPVKTQSPKYYNYTTDSYIAEWTLDRAKLYNYVESLGGLDSWLHESGWQSTIDLRKSIVEDTKENVRKHANDDPRQGNAILKMYQEKLTTEGEELYDIETTAWLAYFLSKVVDLEGYDALMLEDADEYYYENGTEVIKKVGDDE